MDIAIPAKKLWSNWILSPLLSLPGDSSLIERWRFLQRNQKERNGDLRREYILEKGYKIEKMWEYEAWQNLKTNEKIKNYIRSNWKNKRGILLWLYSVWLSCAQVGINYIDENMQTYAIEIDLLITELGLQSKNLTAL